MLLLFLRSPQRVAEIRILSFCIPTTLIPAEGRNPIQCDDSNPIVCQNRRILLPGSILYRRLTLYPDCSHADYTHATVVPRLCPNHSQTARLGAEVRSDRCGAHISEMEIALWCLQGLWLISNVGSGGPHKGPFDFLPPKPLGMRFPLPATPPASSSMTPGRVRSGGRA